MPRLLGENYLPESVMSQRRRIRERINDMRQPVRRRRQDLVPGPDIIGRAESMLTNARNNVLRREGLGMDMMNLRERLNGDGEEVEDEEADNGNGEQNNSNPGRGSMSESNVQV